ncbi:MAG TPA: xylulokinase [Candidatus Agrococcus pullicola]|uniref:Xylulose kinase n=1 Tax=Candidatus Agrococcus pullicola TaxID=2838429 RepID=A0A9D2CBP2_9MICO|nr:xylulokinase [Candidatus Agrococcus pullicola]
MLIAHDLGTTGNKASLHDERGRLLEAVTVEYPAHFADGGIAEQDPDDWYDAVITATSRLLTKAEVDRASVHGMVISGQMMGAVLLDETHRPVRPAIIWADTRAGRQAALLNERLGEHEAYRLHGHRINSTYSLAKVMWVRDNEPETFARVRHVCVAKDYVVHRLTGRLATDRSDASSTNAYDIGRGAWSAETLAAAELDPALFPEIVESIEVVGSLTQDAASATGLPASTRVVMGGGDGPIAAVGAGVVAPEDGAYIAMGTSSWISFASGEPVLDPSMRTFTFEHVVPGLYVPTATMQAAGASVAWINEILSPDPSGASLRELVGRASTEDADTGGLFFLPYLFGERSPKWNTDARGAFVGIGRHHERQHMMRAVLEGVAFNLAECLDAYADNGYAFDSIDAVGGGAASDAWLQIMADVWGVQVHRRSVVGEANSLGAAVVGLVGLGLADDFSPARELSDVVAAFEPNLQRHERYRERLERFRGAYDALEPWMNEEVR